MKGAHVDLFCVRNRQSFWRFLNLVIMIDEVYEFLGEDAVGGQNQTRETALSTVEMQVQQSDRQVARRDVQVPLQYHVVPFATVFYFVLRC